MRMNRNYKILVVDDEQAILSMVKMHLELEGYLVMTATEGREALTQLSNAPDLILLDINMQGMNGIDLCSSIRDYISCPILFLTARVSGQDKVNGFKAGGDDYITKPFNPLELAARVKTQLRRYLRYNTSETTPNQQIYDFNGLMINNNNHKCTLYDQPLNLTPLEFSILWYLCSKKGSVVTSEELFEAVWQEKYLDNNNTVMAHVARLREKMHENARKPKFIKTVWGVGYTIE